MADNDSRLKTILDSIADGVFTIDMDKNITSFNRAAERITGIRRRQAIGQKCFDVFHANICQGRCAMEKTIRTGKPSIDMSINILNSSGKTVPISISTAVLKDPAGKVIGGVETFRDLSAIEEMRREIRKQYRCGDIISKNHEMQQLFAVLPDIAQSDSTVLIQGVSGSGKELVARALHNQSRRSRGPFVAVNCGALPDTLLESELFGYVKGAFTDAKKDKPGRFALAEKGTLFLDEIGDLSAALQVKLLRVLQEGEYEPLGATRPVRADARIITATNKDLLQLVSQGRVRDDFYYRINVVKVSLPPLARRREDIPLLVEHFIDRFNLKTNKHITGADDEAMAFFMRYDFPGNIRELENMIEHAFVLCRDGVIRMQCLPQELVREERTVLPAATGAEAQPLQEAERRKIIETLEEYKGNRTQAACALGINKSTLWRKMKKLQISF
ncbi:MAG: PAS domain S-box protein [Deltaproteobacteria bacterium]|nr:PAS domain S-box protein [Deltaproteobacteria bacterium]